MLEAKLAEASVLKKLLDAIKELVTDANFECSEEGITLQAMDNSHVALVAVKLVQNGFKKYRCDRPMPLGVNVGSLTKVLKCAKDDDVCTLRAADEADVLNLVYEAKNSDRISSYDLKLMDIDAETLGIPKTSYEARIVLSSAEFTRIVRDLSLLGDSVRIEVSKEGVRFASDGEAANGNVLLKGQGPIGKVERGPQGDDSDEEDGDAVKKEKKDDGEEGDEEEEEVDKEEEGEKEKDKKKKDKAKVKKEKVDDGDVEMDEEEYQPDEDGEEEKDEDEDEDEDEDGESKKRKKKSNSSPRSAKKAKTASSSKSKKGKSKANDGEEDEDEAVIIQMNSHVSLTFSLKYLVNFSKSSNLVKRVELYMSNDVPLLVSYDFGQGYIRYYLAPKIGDD
ncbi:proliferating cell nuclear antigen, N-terminal domain-containing protein [Lentinula raphanica]|nr:proliferating cell nuclear antigen, N-terminal domain-containing protein [Lentinula raphanica]KAJ3767891.1 proliferating cell nuclear antigen, N-terminal domain-containing protein [Lentinula raphanica]KAJ3821875.1 proliferating cell nuclear antigen, N-terminal domain-containing protein [Lentinula raphanica]KAJ3970110.1 proliferating cell nuclear antigen, N-terminal domain-containing protein [Lentinula raphanica]